MGQTTVHRQLVKVSEVLFQKLTSKKQDGMLKYNTIKQPKKKKYWVQTSHNVTSKMCPFSHFKSTSNHHEEHLLSKLPTKLDRGLLQIRLLVIIKVRAISFTFSLFTNLFKYVFIINGFLPLTLYLHVKILSFRHKISPVFWKFLQNVMGLPPEGASPQHPSFTVQRAALMLNFNVLNVF